jgi:hypothetical protein
MSIVGPAFPFVDADKIDIRRFCGYPAFGTGVIVFPFPWWFKYYQALEVRILNLTADENLIVQQYLTQLRTMEAAIPGAGANLDTDEAAVWKHNPNEVRDRERLFDRWRLRFCGFLGLPPGPDLADKDGSVRIEA